MAVLPSQKKPCLPDQPDLISTLPGDIVSKILIHLPIQEAGRTSTLSSHWKFAWASIPDLVFFDDRNTIRSLVDQVLSLHAAPIHRFHISTNQFCSGSLERWLRILSRNSIEEITLDFSKSIIHRVPFTLFSCRLLKVVKLSHVTVTLPRNFDGLPALLTLRLHLTTIKSDEFSHLVSRCPLLQYLSLEYCLLSCCVPIKIHAPELRSLSISGAGGQEVHPQWLSTLNQSGLILSRNRISLAQALGDISKIQTLELDSFYLWRYGVGRPLEKLRKKCHDLVKLKLYINLEDTWGAYIALCLFQSAPSLKQLDIQMYDIKTTSQVPVNFWSSNFMKVDWFKHLQTVKIFKFRGSNSLVDFVKFVVGTASTLGSLELIPRTHQNDESSVLKKLLQFPRASTEAKIIYV